MENDRKKHLPPSPRIAEHLINYSGTILIFACTISIALSYQNFTFY